MKKLTLLTLLVVSLMAIFCQNSYAALASTTWWEVDGSAGSDLNGGGFNVSRAGVTKTNADNLTYGASQAVTSFTDLACAEASSTTLTSALGGFTADMVGHVIHINAGTNFTVGYYEITAYTNTNTVTIDRDPTDEDGGDGSSGEGKVGGALATLSEVDGNIIAGNVIYLKAATYTNAGSFGGAIYLIGYNTSRGDNPTKDNRPVIDVNDGAAYCIQLADASSYIYNIRCTDSTGDGITGGYVSSFVNVQSDNHGDEGYYPSYNREMGKFVGCEFNNNTGGGIYYNYNSGIKLIALSYIHDNGDHGVRADSIISVFSMFDTNTSDGVDNRSGYGSTIINCGAYGNTSDGFYSAVGANVILNSSSVSNSSNAFEGTGTVSNYFDYNNYYGHGTELNVYTAGTHDTGDADPLLTNAAAGDFTYQSGSPCLDTAMGLDTISSITGDYKLNIGIDQDDNTTGGGNVIIIDEGD